MTSQDTMRLHERIDDLDKKMSGKVDSLVSNVASLTTALEVQNARCATCIPGLVGNGTKENPGVAVRLDRVEQDMEGMRKAASNRRRDSRWWIALWMTVGGVVAAFAHVLVDFFKRP